MSVEKLDKVQQGIFRLYNQLVAILEPDKLSQVEQTLLDINKSYKSKKEVVRLANVYFTYNLKADKDKYFYLCKKAIKQDNSA